MVWHSKILGFQVHLTSRRNVSSPLMSMPEAMGRQVFSSSTSKIAMTFLGLSPSSHMEITGLRDGVSKQRKMCKNSLLRPHSTYWFPSLSSLPTLSQYCFLLQMILAASQPPLQSSVCAVGSNNSLCSLLRSLLPTEYFRIYFCICLPRKQRCRQGRKLSPANYWQRNWGPEGVVVGIDPLQQTGRSLN